MVFKVDDSVPTDSVDYHWTETTYDGAPDSLVPEIAAHWHKHHDEYIQVLKGRIDFTLDGKAVTLTPKDPTLFIPRRHTHSFKFCKGEVTVLKEKTNPPGDFKEEFFEDLLDDGQVTFTSAMRAGYRGDMIAALPGGIGLLDQAFTNVVGAFVTWWFPQKHKGMIAS